MPVSALSYREPGIVTLLVLSSFILLLNIVNYILDRIVYCGLIGQILIGTAYGLPGANWLSLAVQNAVVQLGYLGLILIVYEGGLSTNLQTLRANLLLSATVALIGITCPIALSFVLQSLLPITPLQAFAAGAALCSTSLGTTFTVLSTSGLTESRLGVVLSSAAMMDDVVGFVMVQVISNLGTNEFDAASVVRPVLVSVGFAVVVPVVCRWVVRPLTVRCYSTAGSKSGRVNGTFRSRNTIFLIHTGVLIAMVTGASYAGTSDLFAAYLAGAAVTWWSDLRLSLADSNHEPNPPHVPRDNIPTEDDQHTGSDGDHSQEANPREAEAGMDSDITPDNQPKRDAIDVSLSGLSGIAIYEHFYGPAVKGILKPFFFASIGFSIPITKMFASAVVWRGFVYAVLMALGKMVCGLCLVRFTSPLVSTEGIKRLVPSMPKGCWPLSKDNARREPNPSSSAQTPAEAQVPATMPSPVNNKAKFSRLPKPRSLYPAAILGSAMVARGEIGFLISSVAETRGIFGQGTDGSSSKLFLVVTWAILLCTILGPVSVGLLVKRVRRLQERARSEKTGKEDPLGIWGIGSG